MFPPTKASSRAGADFALQIGKSQFALAAAKLTLSVWSLELIHCAFVTSLVPVLFVTLTANVTSGIPRRYSFVCAK